MSEIKITDIAIDELSELSKLYDELVGEKTDFDQMINVFKEMEARDDYYLLGAKIDDELVGSIMGVICLGLISDCRPMMVMENMIVKSTAREKGAGKLLMDSLENIARDRDCNFIQFCSSSFRKGAHRFYEACGYSLDEVKGYRKYLKKEDC